MTSNKDDYPSLKGSHALDSRVGKLEGAVETLGQNVQAITTSVNNLTDSFGNFKEDVISKIGQVSAPKWPLIASFATMVLTIFGLCATVLAILLSGQSASIDQNRTQLAQANDRFIQMAYDAGEINAWKTTVAQQIEAVDTKLKNRILTTEAHLEHVREWKLKHLEESSYKFGSLETIAKNIVEDYKTFRNYTSSNRWTKDDQHHFELLLTERVKVLEGLMRDHDAKRPNTDRLPLEPTNVKQE